MKRSRQEWKKILDSHQYEVMFAKATEAPFSGTLLHNKDDGTYVCAACGAELFSSETKFDSGSGWPSFNNVINNQAVDLKEDNSLGLRRIEVSCRSCGGHLGHVFHDAPDQPTGMRFCINSTALNFKPVKKTKKT